MDVTILRKTRFIRLLAATAAASVATLTAGCGDKTAAQMTPTSARSRGHLGFAR